MNYAMVDIETLGKRPGCHVVSIGACLFDEKRIYDAYDFYRIIKLRNHPKLEMDVGTICWWMQQSDEARAVFNSKDSHPVEEVFEDFATWYRMNKVKRVYCHGLTFDVPIITAVCDILGMKEPYGYRDGRDTRTVYDLAPDLKMESVGVKHNALDDAKSQALHCIKVWSTLK